MTFEPALFKRFVATGIIKDQAGYVFEYCKHKFGTYCENGIWNVVDLCSGWLFCTARTQEAIEDEMDNNRLQVLSMNKIDYEGIIVNDGEGKYAEAVQAIYTAYEEEE